MRRLVASIVIVAAVISFSHPAHAYTVVDGFLSESSGVEPYQVILNMKVNGVVIGDSIFLTIVCSATAGAWYAASTKITECKVSSSSGGSVSAIVPMSMSGPEAATAGAGTLPLGELEGCIAGEAQFILAGPHVVNRTCGGVGGL